VFFAPPPPEPVALAVPPPPPLAPVPPSTGAALSLQEAPLLAPVVRSVAFFADALVGKDRRVRPLDATDAGIADLAYAQCSPLVGLKIGIAKRFENDWELAGAVGLAISLVNADHKTNEHELFVDVEANKFLRGGVFVGTGLSLWDLAHSDTFTPAWMVHVGLPLTRNPSIPVHLLVEGRLFFDHADDIRNNYQFWGGVRVHF
jgi:hypothetical protein